jgi:zinc protease
LLFDSAPRSTLQNLTVKNCLGNAAVRSTKRKPWFIAFIAGIAFAHPAFAEPAINNPLPSDPAVRIGALANGVIYWLRENHTPPGKIELWLKIRAGSLNEEDSERGLAHLLEHMAFRGSKHFPGSEITSRFEGFGATNGRDENAYTGFEETVYMLSLPDNREQTLDLALLAFSDIAFGLTLDPAALEQERNIVMEERRRRSGSSERLFRQILPIVNPGSRVAERLPIGDETVVREARSADLKRFYRKWYRPRNTAILLAGDVKPALAERLIKKHFSGWARNDDPAPAPDHGVRPYDSVRAAVVTDPEITEARIRIISIKSEHTGNTEKDLRDSLALYLGVEALNRRLMLLIQSGKAPFARADAGVYVPLPDRRNATAEARGEPKRWREMLDSLASELHRALALGFTKEEIEAVKHEWFAAADHAVASAPTRQSGSFVSYMADAEANGFTPRSAAQARELKRRFLPTIIPREVAAAFRSYFVLDRVLYLVTLPTQQAPISEKEVLTIARAAQAKRLAPYEPPAYAKGFLERDPDPGQVAHTVHDKGLGLTSVTFDNGVDLRVKPMTTKKDSVSIEIRIGGGMLEESADNHGITLSALSALLYPSTDILSESQIELLSERRQIFAVGGLASDALRINISCPSAAVEDALRLAHLLITRARIDPTRFRLWRESILRGIESRKFDLDAALYKEVYGFYYGKDVRFTRLERHHIEAITLASSQAWLDRILRTGRLEAAIAGDISEEKAISLGQRYLGSLPERSDHDSYLEPLRQVSFPTGPYEATVSVPTQTLRAHGYVGWRGPDSNEASDRRVLTLAAAILNRRLYQEIREQRGLVYGISCNTSFNDAVDDMGRFDVRFTADPEKVYGVARLARETVERLAHEGPTEEEVDIARRQLTITIEESLQQPGSWADRLSNVRHKPVHIEEIRSFRKDYASLKAADVSKVMRRYIIDERRVQVVSIGATTKASKANSVTISASGQPISGISSP